MLATIIIFILILSLLVFVHELGHFLTARLFGVKVEEFGMGLPPRLLGFQFGKRQELKEVAAAEEISITVDSKGIVGGQEMVTEKITEVSQEIGVLAAKKKWRLIWGNREIKLDEPMVYSLNWIPVGGFVKIKGENGEAKGDENSFSHKKIWQRVVILAAGVTMNIILCIFLLALGFMIGMPASVEQNHGGKFISEPKVQIAEVLPSYPAAAAGLMAGDIIVQIDGAAIHSGGELKSYLEQKENQAVKVEISRGGQLLEKDITVVRKNDLVGLGVAIVDIGIVRYPWYLALVEGALATWSWLVAILAAAWGLIKQLFGGPAVGLDFAGPVGIAVLTGQAAKLGWIYVLQFAALLSLNLAIINILPFPALDGGRIMFLAFEKIRGRAVNSKLENFSHNLGFILLMILIVAITYRDLAKYGAKILQAVGRAVGLS